MPQFRIDCDSQFGVVVVIKNPARNRVGVHVDHHGARSTGGSLAQVITTLGSKMPTHRAVRGGAMNGADCISLAELTQYALISVSSGSQDFDGLPRATRSASAPPSVLGPGGPDCPGSPCGPAGPRAP
jgi:hypothetical protein